MWMWQVGKTRLQNWVLEAGDRIVENKRLELERAKRARDTWIEHVDVLPNWTCNPHKGFGGFVYSHGKVELTIPWNMSLLSLTKNTLMTRGWKLVGDERTPGGKVWEFNFVYDYTTEDGDEEALHLDLQMTAVDIEKADERHIAQTCKLVQIDTRVTTYEHPVYDIVCPEGYEEYEEMVGVEG